MFTVPASDSGAIKLVPVTAGDVDTLGVVDADEVEPVRVVIPPAPLAATSSPPRHSHAIAVLTGDGSRLDRPPKA